MATFILLPGGWAGGWQYCEVAVRLAEAGSVTDVPALPAGGAMLCCPEPAALRRRGPRAGSTLSRFRSPACAAPITAAMAASQKRVQEVQDLIRREALRDVVLVSFFLSEGIATAVARRATDHIQHLVYVNARFPRGCPRIAHGRPPTYIRCTASSMFAGATAPAAGLARRAGWSYCELPLDGSARIAEPAEVAAQILRHRVIERPAAGMKGGCAGRWPAPPTGQIEKKEEGS